MIINLENNLSTINKNKVYGTNYQTTKILMPRVVNYKPDTFIKVGSSAYMYVTWNHELAHVVA
jgi:hypothetical protein